MTYVDGFVLAVPSNKIEEYRAIATKAAAIWKELGALSYVECVSDDVTDYGHCKTFPSAFGAEKNEVVIFAYITYKSREHRDVVNAKVHADPRLKEMCNPDDMPFDCSRMAYGGFKSIVEL